MAKVPDRYLEERRQEILAAASRVFVQKGYSSATMQEIASACDLAPGTLYRYFPGKADLIAEVAGACYAQDRAMYAAALASESPLSALFEVGEQVRIGIPLNEWREHCVLRLESYLAAEREPALKARLQAELVQSIETMATIIREAQAAGEIDASVDAAAMSALLHAIGSGLSTMMLPLGGDASVDDVWGVLVRMIGALLTPEGLAVQEQIIARTGWIAATHTSAP